MQQQQHPDSPERQQQPPADDVVSAIQARARDAELATRMRHVEWRARREQELARGPVTAWHTMLLDWERRALDAENSLKLANVSWLCGTLFTEDFSTSFLHTQCSNECIILVYWYLKNNGTEARRGRFFLAAAEAEAALVYAHCMALSKCTINTRMILDFIEGWNRLEKTCDSVSDILVPNTS